MANRFVSGTGSNTSPYDTWAKAATTLATAITGSSADDVFVIDAASPGADVTGTTTWTFLGNASVIASTNSGTSTITPTTMGTTTWLGSVSSFGLTVTGAYKIYFYGITFRTGGSTSASITLNSADGGHFVFDSCYIWMGTTNSTSRLTFGAASATFNNYTNLYNTTIRFGNVSQGILASGDVEIFGGDISSAGSATTTLFLAQGQSHNVSLTGTNLSHITGTLVGSNASSGTTYKFSQCRFGSSVTVLATQTPANKSSAKAFVFDCSDGDTHGLFGYYDAFGSIVSDTGTYLTAGAAGQSWQITTTANCSFGTPFVTPWINLYNSGASATTYKLELLRNNGTASAYGDASVWGEFSVKDNSGFTNSDIFTDRQALADWAAGTAGSTSGRTGVGTGSWTIGSSNSPASFIVDSGTTITQAEAGHIRARVAVGATSVSNLFLDPQIRT
jgi:hypothetical protein